MAEETYQEIDLLEFKHRRDMEQREIDLRRREAELEAQTRRERNKHLKEFGLWLLGALTLLAIGFGIYIYVTGPEPPYRPDPELTREETCMDHGGTWLPASVLYGEDGMCVMPGQEVR